MDLIKKTGMFITVVLLLVAAYSGGYYFGRRGFEFEIKRNPPKITILNKTPQDQTVDFGLFWKVWGILNTEHINRPLDSQELLYGALRGLMQSVGDPYTSFLNPDQNKQITQALNSKYEGIGAELSEREGRIVVVSPLSGSPAESAGLKAGDAIVKIDNESTAGITLPEAVLKIRGPENTDVVLTVSRKKNGDEETVDIKITRGVISLESVRWEDKGDGVAYIRISRFGDDTSEVFQESVTEILNVMPNLKAVILDVRSNPGGYLEASTVIASEFLEKGTIVIQELADGTKQPIKVSRPGRLIDKKLKIAVLINGGSASASEIVAGSLRDNRDAVLVGDKSFGKGTIQDAKDFEDGSGIHITIAKWLTPKGEWVHEKGLTPDIEVAYDESVPDTDEQLDKALEAVKM